MNSRITLDDDKHVRIRRRDGDASRCNFSADAREPNELLIEHFVQFDFWDAEGRAALIDCLQCLRDTGSFAALSDTSNVTFVGKRMRLGPDGVAEERGYRSGMEVTVLRAFPDYPIIKTDLLPAIAVRRCDLLPLTPAPRVRPYTPVEAAAHLGRTVKANDGKLIGLDGVTQFCAQLDKRLYAWDYFAKCCTWADDNSPCGILEQP